MIEKECPECTTMVDAGELEIFNGVCENCYETKNDDGDDYEE